MDSPDFGLFMSHKHNYHQQTHHVTVAIYCSPHDLFARLLPSVADSWLVGGLSLHLFIYMDLFFLRHCKVFFHLLKSFHFFEFTSFLLFAFSLFLEKM